MVTAAAPDATRYISALACARVHFGGGVGLCLTDEARGATVRHAVYIFDRAFARGRRIDLGGTPTRVRVSPNGKLAAITMYAEEHTPDGGERLATRALVFDLAGGDVILDLRDVTIDSSGHTTSRVRWISQPRLHGRQRRLLRHDVGVGPAVPYKRIDRFPPSRDYRRGSDERIPVT